MEDFVLVGQEGWCVDTVNGASGLWKYLERERVAVVYCAQPSQHLLGRANPLRVLDFALTKGGCERVGESAPGDGPVLIVLDERHTPPRFFRRALTPLLQRRPDIRAVVVRGG